MSDGEMRATDVSHDQNETESLESLLAQATAHYAQKNYKTAAELYSRATELQALANGEMSTENADLLYLYGRCLYHVAVEKSDVLGSKVAGEKRDPGFSDPEAGSSNKKPNGVEAEGRIAEEVIAEAATEANHSKVGEQERPENKPYFQFTGDENFDSDDEEDATRATEDGGAGEEDDDFSNAFEILDLARVLLQRKLEEFEAKDVGKSKEVGDADAKRQLKERLADTHDLQAEISLEGEQFQNAVNDLRAALALKQELHPADSSLVAEIHYKLSLALEFSSVTEPKDENGEVDQNKAAHVDEALREEAAKEMEAAIASCRLRIGKEETVLAAGEVDSTDSKPKITRKSIDEVKDMVQDMEQRVCNGIPIPRPTLLIATQLVELRQPPVSIADPRGTGSIDGAAPLSGLLGSILGESPGAQKARIEQATKQANDLTDLVKRKKPTASTEADLGQNGTPTTGSKRRVGFAEEVEELGTGKRAKVEDGMD